MIFVYQDARGRNYSEGDYTEMTPHKDHKGAKDVDESSDTYDTIDWLVKNVPHNNGRVAIYGTSYPGFYTTASCIDPHPALKACEPGAPMTDLWMGDDLFHNGAFMLGANFDFYQGYGRTPRAPELGPDPRYERPNNQGNAYKFFLDMGPIGPGSRKSLPPETAPLWDIVMHHPSYDAYWQARDISRHVKRVPAMLEVGGYYDAEDLAGPWRTFRGIERLSPGSDNHIAIGPWSHGGWARGDGNAHGNLRWNTTTGPWFRDSIEFPFFMHYLADGPKPALSKVLVYRTGGEKWDRFDAWPPKNSVAKSLYLLPGGKLAWTKPQAAASAGKGPAFDDYVSDPANPVPVGEKPSASGMPRDYMTGDQRFASKRADVLTYQTEPLTEDVTIIGPVSPVLHVATSGTDADFDVKLIDVFPVRRAQLGRRHDGLHRRRLPTARARRAVSCPLSQGSSEARRVRAESAGLAPLLDARHRSHVQEGAPDHDSDPELVVPAERSQPADVRAEHLRGEAGRLQDGDDARLSRSEQEFARRRSRDAVSGARDHSFPIRGF